MIVHIQKLKVCLLITAASLLITGPGWAEIFDKAKPAEETTDFIEGSMLRPKGDLPFNKAWRASKMDREKFTEIYVAPVNTEYLRQSSWWKELNLIEIEEDIDELAGEFRSTIRRAFFNDPRRRLRVVNRPGPNTLIMEIAIVELIPNKAGFELLMTAAGPASGVAGATLGAGVAKTIGSKSTIAIEARLRDGEDGGIVAMFADREQEKGSIISIRNFTWYGQVKVITKEWADQFVKIANKSPNDIISDTPTFTFKPW
jgi:hypothetical protein